ncbi:hypothetical protein ACEWAS_22670, partial [Vibrio parahaemolyticus]
TIGWVYANPFTGYVHIHDLKIFEEGGMDTVFFSAKGVSAHYAIWKMLKKTYEIKDITLTSPQGRVIQDHHKLNFSDII